MGKQIIRANDLAWPGFTFSAVCIRKMYELRENIKLRIQWILNVFSFDLIFEL